ncbi:conjugal transfer protein TraD [Pseudobutyrivibrio sp.]|uniref:conjugal transfer protein TraD n=1 Tax=Pseudobutyrivibrio sp. TaxID=2014367 RepID=UPI001B67471D|nr:conjugal transfer protein TraD [Pseudobutyrivibrio sp.]MBP3263246.1 conjugal transfer protein TraD [Pseudobutyrivibrio sp.]
MAKRSVEERLEEIKAKKDKLAQLERKLKAEQSKKTRNERTRRLIEIGAIIEKALNMELDTPEKRERLLAKLTEPQKNNKGGTSTWGMYFHDVVKGISQ